MIDKCIYCNNTINKDKSLLIASYGEIVLIEYQKKQIEFTHWYIFCSIDCMIKLINEKGEKSK